MRYVRNDENRVRATTKVEVEPTESALEPASLSVRQGPLRSILADSLLLAWKIPQIAMTMGPVLFLLALPNTRKRQKVDS